MAAVWILESRLSSQEMQLRQLSTALEQLQRECEDVLGGPELHFLREENEKLKYRRLHLERSLRAELGKGTAGSWSSPQERGSEAQVAVIHSGGSLLISPDRIILFSNLSEKST
eukprot:g21919.t1